MLRWLRDEASIIARLLVHPLLWLLLVFALVGAVAAYQVRHSYDVDVGVGRGTDRLLLSNFHDPRTETGTNRTFRWSDAYGYIDLPGTGGGVPFTVTLTLNTGRPNVPVTIIINGETFLQSTFSAGWRTLVFSVDASHTQALSPRDLVVEIRTPGYPAPDEPDQIQGVMLDSFQISATGPGFVTPSIIQLVYLAVAIMLVYLFLGRIFFPLHRPSSFAGRPSPFVFRSPRWLLPSLLGGLVAAIVLDALLAWEHLSFTSATGEMAGPVLGAIVSYLLLVLVEPFARRIVPGTKDERRKTKDDGRKDEGRRLGARVIASLVGLAFLVRIGAVLLPQVNIIDLPWHMKWLRELFNRQLAGPLLPRRVEQGARRVGT